MDIFLLYLFTRLDPLNGALSLIFGALVLCAGCFLMVWLIAGEELPAGAAKRVVHNLRWYIPLVLFVGFTKVMLPTQKDAALILAGYGVIEVAKSETAGRLAGKSVQLIEQALDGYLKPEKK